jgi:uncharacterized RDD family membrane protein YckC
VGYLIDMLILTLYCVVIVVLLLNLDVEKWWVWMIAIAFPYLFYSLFFEVIGNGQTPGKYIMKSKVVRLDGTPPTLGNYLLRWLFRFVDFYMISGAVAVVFISSGRKGQRLGDKVAGTSVIKLIEQKEITAQDVFVVSDDTYSPTFSQVMNLTSKDIELIQQALEVNRDHGNTRPVEMISTKIKTLLGIETDLPPVKFLYTIVKDYNHLSS